MAQAPSESDVAQISQARRAPDLVSPASAQLTLELPAPPATAETPLVPVRIVNEFVYCPRLAFLEWVDGE
jgi:CRISPR-associated exonuclease Cas4/CRISPR-associated protein Cas1